ncbi:protein PET117 homolog, mitochondrial-like [Babylonia areolata]|uniref:protein PET117 homolog, mitochondrial-like n=1 Tax=Babylonia areolata TaxID=304850 RepID=UPI003FD25800
MSTASKVTLGASITFTIGIITYVHLWQKKERERLRQGVVMDLERQQRRQANIRDQEQQAQLTEILQQQQQQQTEQANSS